jgi:hypothetical protein
MIISKGFKKYMEILNEYFVDRIKSDYKVDGLTLNLSIIKMQSRKFT